MWGSHWLLCARRLEPGNTNRIVVKTGVPFEYEQWIIPSSYGELPTFLGTYGFGPLQPRTFPYGFEVVPDQA